MCQCASALYVSDIHSNGVQDEERNARSQPILPQGVPHRYPSYFRPWGVECYALRSVH